MVLNTKAYGSLILFNNENIDGQNDLVSVVKGYVHLLQGRDVQLIITLKVYDIKLYRSLNGLRCDCKWEYYSLHKLSK